jgi:hypothetical protein
MKRDLDLIRLILLEIESGTKSPELDTYTVDQITYHGALVIEAGLVKGIAKGINPDLPNHVRFHRLTWAGHDFLDSARSEPIWNKAKETIKKKGGSWTFDFVTELLKALLREAIL